MDEKFMKIVHDRISGSSEILQKCFSYFKEKFSAGSNITDYIEYATNNLSHFTGIRTNLIALRSLIDSGEQLKAMQLINDILLKEKSVYKEIYNAIPDEVKKMKRITTISNSKTVFEILKLWFSDQINLCIYISESQPEKEGRILCAKLIKENISANCFPDNELSSNIEKSDLLLIGCDSVLKSGDIVNKTGTRDATIIANYFNKQVIVVTSKDKFVHNSIKSVDLKSNFQLVERQLITAIITV